MSSRPSSLPAPLILLTLLTVTPPAAHSQAKITPLPASSPGKGKPVENQALEDNLARAFDQLRARDGLRPLSRIPDRPALRQLVCTAAQTGTQTGTQTGIQTGIQTGTPLRHDLDLEANAASTIVRMADPSHLPPEFLTVAGYNDHGADPSHRITRYSIAAWPDLHDPATTWVGVSLYWSHLRQAFAIRFTGDYRPPDIWHDLAPACVDVR